MINRSGFLTLFWGLLPFTLRAQPPICPHDPKTCGDIDRANFEQTNVAPRGLIASTGVVPESRKPKNGQCPVCRTMADPFPHQMDFAPKNCRPVAGQEYIIACDAPPKVKTSRLVRCAACNNAFYMDSE